MDISIRHCTSGGYGPRAAGLAAHIQDELAIPVKLERGSPGQFDVVVDGKVVASRNGNLVRKIFGGGWPNHEAVVAAIEQARS